MEELLKKYKEMRELVEKFNYAMFIMSFDEATDCPKLDKEHSMDVQNFFYGKIIEIVTSDSYKKLVNDLYAIKEQLDEISKKDIELEYKDMMKLEKIPKDELFRHIENASRAGLAWENGRKSGDFSRFIPEINELIDYNKKYMTWQETDKVKGYNVLLDDMEEGYTQKMYDEFFQMIEKELVPFVQDILKKGKKYNPVLDTLRFDIEKQKKITYLIAEKMGYTKEVGCIRETVHPFTNWANNKDVRITTSYHEDLLFSNLYSVMHEIGHALYQLQMDEKYNSTNIFNSVTCISHESQSRFYENYLGRSHAFIEFLYPLLKEEFPLELKDITLEDVYYYVNNVSNQTIRVEADELTYPIHILIRYNVEKDLFNGIIDASGIEEDFNRYMNKYLGVVPKDMANGCFQDSHWSSGFGYFPTYALGSAYGIHFLDAIKKEIDVDSCMRKGSFKEVNSWLKEHIHHYSGTRRNLEMLTYATGVEFDPYRYIAYLKDKFSKIYQ